MLRSDFLVHWTGKDIGLDPFTLTNVERKAYVDRLISILDSGFWMTESTECVQGNGESWFEYKALLVCFTEIRMSQVLAHAQVYGLAGIVVSRKFVLDRFGTPVIYVRNHENETLVTNLVVVSNYLKALATDEDSTATNAKNALGDAIARLKAMSSINTDDFKYIEEQEWRVIHLFRLEEDGFARPNVGGHPKYFLNLTPADVQGLVFPDDVCRSMVLSDSRFIAWLEKRPPLAFTLTLDECQLF